MVDQAGGRVAQQSLAAVRELALGLGVLQERLEGACDELLMLESKEVAEPLREEFKSLIATIMDIEELSALSDVAAVTLAERIVAYYEHVTLGHQSDQVG